MPNIITGRSLFIDGVNSASLDIYTSCEPVFNFPAREYEQISIPGRNGDLIIDGGRWKNIDVQYNCIIPCGFKENAQAIRDYFAKASGEYVTIADNYNPAEFRLGTLKGGVEFKPMYTNQAAAIANVTFSCKPQRFLTSGAVYSSIYSGETINNQTSRNALPKIRVTNPSVGDLIKVSHAVDSRYETTFTVSIVEISAYGTMVIDCENQSVDDGEVKFEVKNGNNSACLHSGINKFYIDGYSTVEIMPRWWEL